MRLSPPADPRNLLPSRAHPEHRQTRKQLEKQHQIGLKEVGVLSLIGLTLAWNIENQVRKCEEKKQKGEEEQRKRDDQEHYQRENSYHDRAVDSRRSHRSPYRNRSSGRGDWDGIENYARGPRRQQSVGYRTNSRRDDQYRGEMPRHDPQDNRRYGSKYQYDDPRDLDLAGRGGSRRDSW
ncbi:hypothetical protein GQX73_g4833 [Xylaria multiplex]|uniref:Uncharacterized protein n=1 Tax=Xylaria multiplex TaxID=323545 RepID=A0A7C8MV41_9PEZI|nr:hypothetical protein GQX73_g4833 [Xylaria multiplex]